MNIARFISKLSRSTVIQGINLRSENNFHTLTGSGCGENSRQLLSPRFNNVENLAVFNFLPIVRYFKVKGKHALRLRCENCYFVLVCGRWHVDCSNGRHKQRDKFDRKLLW